MSTTRVVWLGARVVVGVGLVALLVLGLGDAEPAGGVSFVSSETSADRLAAALAVDGAASVSFVDSVAPSREVTRLLSGAAARGIGVRLVVPGVPPALEVSGPAVTVAHRRSALTVTVRAAPGTEVPIAVGDASGVSDTLTVRVGNDGDDLAGVAVVSVAVEPSRPGANSWTVSMGTDSVEVTSWTRPEAPVRMLVLSASPGWETRAMVRALEEAGGRVTTWSDLGRELSVGTRGAAVPTRVADLMDFDVLALVGAVPGMSLDTAFQWVGEVGGGLLVVNATPAAAGSPPERTVRANALRWSGPAEIVPLPAADLDLTVLPLLEAAGPATVVAAADELGSILAEAESYGRGRIFRSGVQTWPFVLEAGLGAAHTAYWESVVEWLASGLRGDRHLQASAAAPHMAWRGTIEGAVPDTVTVVSPGGGTGVQRSVQRRSDGTGIVRFVPNEVGEYVLGGGLDAGVGVATGRSTTSWVDAALEVGAAGGEVEVAAQTDMSRANRPLGASTPWRLPVFVLLAGAALAGWAVRRLAGLA
jgi:hypothetical protein